MLRKSNIAILFVFLLLGACESASEQQARQIAAVNKAKMSSVAPDGMAIFRQNCVVCHGSDGNLGLNGAKHLSESILPVSERVNIITNGKNLMTPFRALLSPQEIDSVAAYTLTFKK